MMQAEQTSDFIQQEYERIMGYACEHGNDETYASMMSSWQAGLGVMPDDFGLGAEVFNELLDHHFKGLTVDDLNLPDRKIDESRLDECEDVYNLLIGGRANKSESEVWMAKIVAVACQGQDHLWQDMGLWSRKQLTALLMNNFPSLASKNEKNMKWKKFLYKQLCITEGIYTCRAPSCEVCADYQVCFSPED